MQEPILVLNAGSSSIKFSVFESLADGSLKAGAHGQVDGIGAAAKLEVSNGGGRKISDLPAARANHEGAIAAIHDWFATHLGREARFSGVGHRVVHGGEKYFEPALITEMVIADLEALVPLAPLHQPHHIAVIHAVRSIAPDVPQVACFDTAFHRTQPVLAQAFALPQLLVAKGIRRYGFHGLSYEYVVSMFPKIAPQLAQGRLIIAHLGNGASMCAVREGRSVASTMGFTAVDGLPMGTRTGALDPGVILYLLQHEKMDAQSIQHLVYQESGLLGVSGLSSDMRTLLASDVPAAKEAVDLFVYRIGRELGSLIAALGGLDALIFTAGIGEHAALIRARVCKDAEWFGIQLDDQANANGGPLITFPGSHPSAWVLPTDENLMIALHTRRLLGR